MDMYINYLMNRPVTLDEMISSLMDEWLTRAIISGNNIRCFRCTTDNDKMECQFHNTCYFIR